MKKKTIQLIAIIAVLFIAVSRLIFIDLANIAPIAAAGIFAAFYIRNKTLSYVVPLVGLFITDFIVHLNTGYGLYSTRIIDYLGFALAIFVAHLIFKQKRNALTVLGATLSGSLIFFFVSNFGVWLFDNSMYTNDLPGLLHCLEMGIPFYKATFLGDLVFTGVFFGAFEAWKQFAYQDTIVNAN